MTPPPLVSCVGVDPELYELTTAKLDPSGSGSRMVDAFARLMSTMEKTSTSTRYETCDLRDAAADITVFNSAPLNESDLKISRFVYCRRRPEHKHVYGHKYQMFLSVQSPVISCFVCGVFLSLWRWAVR